MIDYATKCSILGRVSDYLDTFEGAPQEIGAFLAGQQPVLTTDDVAEITKWSHAHIYRLCKEGHLPHIPSNPHRFLRDSLMTALREMQVGGVYGRGKTRSKKGGK